MKIQTKAHGKGQRAKIISVFCVLCSLLFVLTSCSANKALKKEDIFDPKEYLSRATQLINDREYEEARKLLIEVKHRDGTREYAPLALLKIAESYVKDGDIIVGIEQYRRFLALYPDNRYTSYAQYQIAMAYFTQIVSPDRGSGEARNALREFIRLQELYPRNPFREITKLRIQQSRNIIADGEFMVGEFYYKRGSYNAAINRFEELLKQFPDHKKEDKTLLLLGRSYKALKMADKAKETFNDLIKRHPLSRFAVEAKMEIKKGEAGKQ